MSEEWKKYLERGLSRRKVLTAGAAATVGGLFSLGAPLVVAQSAPEGGLKVEVVPLSPTQGELDEIAGSLRSGRGVPRSAGALNLRVISVQEIDPEESATSEGRWRAIVYDYAGQVALKLEGSLGDATPDRVETLASQPLPSPSEWAEARDVLLGHPEIGPRLRAGDLVAYRPMPPVIVGNDGHRLVTVGLLPNSLTGTLTNEIVGVDIATGAVQRFAARAPESSMAGRGGACGAILDANQTPTGQGVPGQYAVTISEGSTVYWTFTAIRPSASSGLRGSGIELRNVKYRGRRVLARAHVPILNVSYEGDACGPYRDWQYSESWLTANGTDDDMPPGFRLASSAPESIIQSGTDSGTFRGTAVWINGSEVTLMAELEAGWYRYVSEWTFHKNGTIKPRFGFAAVQNSCVCNVHYHHCYWRFAFDIGGDGDNVVHQRGNTAWSIIRREARRFRDAAGIRKWRVGTRSGTAKYEIRPGHHDGRAQAAPDWPFGVGDVWLLRYHSDEIEDGVDLTECKHFADPTNHTPANPNCVTAKLDSFVDGESIDGANVVVWYAGHFVHDEPSKERGGEDHVIGPDLVPRGW